MAASDDGLPMAKAVLLLGLDETAIRTGDGLGPTIIEQMHEATVLGAAPLAKQKECMDDPDRPPDIEFFVFPEVRRTRRERLAVTKPRFAVAGRGCPLRSEGRRARVGNESGQ